MDVLLQNNTFSEKEASTIETINSSLSRISRINKNLLLLAKIENHQFTEETSVDIRQTLTENIELLDDYFQSKGIQIQINVASYTVKCNQTLLEVLFNNLTTNVIRHGNQDDILQINLIGNKLTFSNTGTTSLNQENLFVRFGISSSETTNSGLGLAISKEICDRYNWKLSYVFNNYLHAFSIEF